MCIVCEHQLYQEHRSAEAGPFVPCRKCKRYLTTDLSSLPGHHGPKHLLPIHYCVTVMVKDFWMTVSVVAVTQACTTMLCGPEAMFRLVLMVEPFTGP
jgi:hypothetical protein